MNKYILEIAVFLCGAVVMVFELVGSRMLGPYFGTSIFVWTSLIGIILGSLSLGYYFGGRFSDRNPSLHKLSLIIFLSGLAVGLTIVFKDGLLAFLLKNISDIRQSSVIASLILFLPASALLGMVSPYAAKLKLNNLATSGSTMGGLYALSTAGSIAGTFLSGFFLIPRFGTDKLLLILSITLALVSLSLALKKLTWVKIFTVIMMITGWFLLNEMKIIAESKGFIDTDTAYNRVWIYNGYNERDKNGVLVFSINNESSSAMFYDSDDLVFEYTKYYDLADFFNPGFKTALMFGGAGYSYPKNFLTKRPGAKIDVVEIDPKVTELAKKYFRLKDDADLAIYHEDGRVYLNKTQKKYDMIFGDAFSSHYSVPYQLTTVEAVRKEYDILHDNGAVILNIIASIEGEKGQFLRAEYATYKNVFPQVYIFPVTNPANGQDEQNIILVALKSKVKPDLETAGPALAKYLDHLWTKEIETDKPILTDDYAPVEHYIRKVI